MSTRDELLGWLAQECPRGASVLEQHAHAVRFFCAKIDEQAAEIAALRKAAEECARDRVNNIPPRLTSRLEALEKIAHVPYDFTALVERLEKLERQITGIALHIPRGRGGV